MDKTKAVEMAVESRAETVQALIARTLGERIVSGTLIGGQKLRQDAIAKEFGASHVPVREAFRQLEARGLLISRPRQGVQVASLTVEAISEINSMRSALELLALRHAIPRITPADIQIAERAILEGTAAKDVSSWEEQNRRFHLALYTPCAMPRLMQAIEELHEARTRYMIATAQIIHWDPHSRSEHFDILEAARFGNQDQACHLLDVHLTDAANLLEDATKALTLEK